MAQVFNYILLKFWAIVLVTLPLSVRPPPPGDETDTLLDQHGRQFGFDLLHVHTLCISIFIRKKLGNMCLCRRPTTLGKWRSNAAILRDTCRTNDHPQVSGERRSDADHSLVEEWRTVGKTFDWNGEYENTIVILRTDIPSC